MDYHGITMQGEKMEQKVATLPAWAADDEGRTIYVEDENKMYYANDTQWVCYVDNDRNAIINGDFNIWQRGTSFVALTTSMKMADRFRYDKVGAMVHTVSRDTDVPTQVESGHKSNYSLKVDCTTIDAAIAAGDFIAISQMVEGYNFASFVGKTATLSFWVKATKPGIYCVSFRNTPVADRGYVSEYTINVANTWEKKTVTLIFNYTGGTWDYTNGIGIEVTWTLASGTNFHTTTGTWQNGDFYGTANQVNGVDSTDNNFWLAQVQFELGSVATDFEYRQFGDELARCQRYYEKSYDYDVAPGTAGGAGAFITYYSIATAGECAPSISYPVTLRANPTITIYSTESGTVGKKYNASDAVDENMTGFNSSGERGHSGSNTSHVVAKVYRFHYTSDAEL